MERTGAYPVVWDKDAPTKLTVALRRAGVPNEPTKPLFVQLLREHYEPYRLEYVVEWAPLADVLSGKVEDVELKTDDQIMVLSNPVRRPTTKPTTMPVTGPVTQPTTRAAIDGAIPAGMFRIGGEKGRMDVEIGDREIPLAEAVAQVPPSRDEDGVSVMRRNKDGVFESVGEQVPLARMPSDGGTKVRAGDMLFYFNSTRKNPPGFSVGGLVEQSGLYGFFTDRKGRPITVKMALRMARVREPEKPRYITLTRFVKDAKEPQFGIRAEPLDEVLNGPSGDIELKDRDMLIVSDKIIKRPGATTAPTTRP